EFTVYADDAIADAAAAADGPVAEVTDAVPFLLDQMWPLRMKARPVARREMTEWLQVPGKVDARPDSLSRVGAPVDGLLVQQGEHAHIGDWVEEGAFLGFVEAPLTTSDRAQLEAVRTDLLAREMDLESKQIEINRDLLEAQAEAEFARVQHDRLLAMREKGLGTAAALDAAARDLLLAETRVVGSEKLQSSLQESLQRLAELRQDLADGLGGSDGTAMRYPLIAPISGEIAAVEAHKGDPVKGQETLFTILRSDRVWIEAEISEFDLGRLDANHRAQMRAPIFGDAVLDFTADLNGSLIHIGRMVDPSDRSVPLRYEVDNPDRKMPIGMFVDVLLATQSVKQALAVPESAIVRDLGVDVVYVVVSGETLQRREVILGIRDGGYVEVRSGLEEGERIIVSDAFRVRLASTSPAAFGEGHTH
ncbi:MAG: efflux RND transporter periplasmic adaptor subunit, partial [Planctomycetota bacterium]